MGITKTDEQTCTSLLNAKSIDSSLVADCYTDSDASGTAIHTAAGHAAFEATYKTACLGKTSCKIPLALPEIKPACRAQLQRRMYTSKYASAADRVSIKTKFSIDLSS